jgi:hypothetical protein
MLLSPWANLMQGIEGLRENTRDIKIKSPLPAIEGEGGQQNPLCQVWVEISTREKRV